MHIVGLSDEVGAASQLQARSSKSANMTVLACGSNAFQQLSPSDQLVISDPVEVHASAADHDLAAASWSQTLLRCASYVLPALARTNSLLLGKAEQ
jgi:hypothetical protein